MKHPELALGTAAALTFTLGLTACSSQEAPLNPEPSASDTPTTGTSACELSQPLPEGDGYVATYLPTWGDAAKFENAAQLTGIDEIKVAFAVVNKDGKIKIDLNNPGFKKTLPLLSKQAKVVSMGLGGWGASDEDHKNILKGFDKGLDNPEEFAADIADAAEQTAKVAFGTDDFGDTAYPEGIKKIGVGLDMEYPDVAQAEKFPALVTALRDEGIENISMAVAATDQGDPVKRVARKLAKLNVTFDLMSYDLNGPWSDVAGPITDRRWIVNKVGEWVEAAGSEKAVLAGVPTYGYPFVGAKAAGEPFDAAAANTILNTDGMGPLTCQDAIADTLTKDAITGTSGAQIEHGWTSLVTPDDAALLARNVRSKYPGVGMFTWEANSMTQGHVDALKQQ